MYEENIFYYVLQNLVINPFNLTLSDIKRYAIYGERVRFPVWGAAGQVYKEEPKDGEQGGKEDKGDSRENPG